MKVCHIIIYIQAHNTVQLYRRRVANTAILQRELIIVVIKADSQCGGAMVKHCVYSFVLI